jgi:hypothetical protein
VNESMSKTGKVNPDPKAKTEPVQNHTLTEPRKIAKEKNVKSN